VASVTQVNGKWRALIRRKGHKSQCKTFRTKAQADTWARQRESELDQGVTTQPATGLTVAQVIEAYRELREHSRPIADTSNEHYMLKALTRGLGGYRITEMTPQHLVAYANMRKEEGAGPYTINMDVSKLGTVMRYGGVALKVVLPDIVAASRPLLSHLRLIGGGGKRERRPTEDELRSVLAYLHKKRGLVYAEAVAFAACSAMRRGEVCAVLKAEIDPISRVLPVWRKHPRQGKVLERVPLLGEAWEIAERQPKSEDGRLFPIHPGTLSKYFTEACRALSIPDLHLHDMRHEGTSRLFEEGYQLHQVALVTGHKKWENLKRYTNLKPEDLTKHDPDKRQGAQQRPGSRRTASPRRGKSEPDTSLH
jgi:integrase